MSKNDWFIDDKIKVVIIKTFLNKVQFLDSLRMEIKILDDKKNKLMIEVKGTDHTLCNAIKTELTQGSKEARAQAIARVINLIGEDREARAKDPGITDLVNTGLHPSQPRAVKEGAISAAMSISGNDTTRQLLTNIAGSKDPYESNEMAAAALSEMSMPGQKLNVVSKP